MRALYWSDFGFRGHSCINNTTLWFVVYPNFIHVVCYSPLTLSVKSFFWWWYQRYFLSLDSSLTSREDSHGLLALCHGPRAADALALRMTMVLVWVNRQRDFLLKCQCARRPWAMHSQLLPNCDVLCFHLQHGSDVDYAAKWSLLTYFLRHWDLLQDLGPANRRWNYLSNMSTVQHCIIVIIGVAATSSWLVFFRFFAKLQYTHTCSPPLVWGWHFQQHHPPLLLLTQGPGISFKFSGFFAPWRWPRMSENLDRMRCSRRSRW